MSLPDKRKGRAGFRHPETILVFGFLALILAGTVLLALPAAARGGKSIGLFDSLFTATSAVCVTGLVAVDTGTVFSFFGQAVLLVLIQVGGLGFRFSPSDLRGTFTARPPVGPPASACGSRCRCGSGCRAVRRRSAASCAASP